MKGLSLTQPWASLVAAGAKAIETRSWRTPYRGPVAIHAAKVMPEWAIDFAREDQVYAAVQSLPWGWLLGEVRHLREPVPCRGWFGLWPVPDDLRQAIEEGL